MGILDFFKKKKKNEEDLNQEEIQEEKEEIFPDLEDDEEMKEEIITSQTDEIVEKADEISQEEKEDSQNRDENIEEKSDEKENKEQNNKEQNNINQDKEKEIEEKYTEEQTQEVEKKDEIEKQENEEKSKKSFFEKLKFGLKKTGDNFNKRLDDIFTKNVEIDEDLYEELEEMLITSDISFNTTISIIDKLRENISKKKIKDVSLVKSELKNVLYDIMGDNNKPLNFDDKKVILIVGVNGVGKTTTIGKLAVKTKNQGKKVLLAAADTFRAAATEQLEIWSKRADVPIIKMHEGADPSAVIYDACQRAKSDNVDVLICDTAGRLHNKKNLMNELDKIQRVISKEYKDAKKEVILVLDATTGQNALNQVKAFDEILELTGIIMTKLDGTAKGGVLISIKSELDLPVRYIGIGERIEDLQEFDGKSYIDAIIE